jgi:hypothetical protein
VAVIPQMVLPFGIDSTLQPDGRLGLELKWLTIHDFAFPGMVGFVFFGLALLGFRRAWSRSRALFAWLVVGQTLLIGLFWGLPGAAAWVAGLGLLPFLFILGAIGLSSLSPTRARWFAGLVALEWLSYIAVLYHPIAGTSVGEYIFGWLLTLAGLASMLLAAYLALTRGWPERRFELAGLRAYPSKTPARAGTTG